MFVYDTVSINHVRNAVLVSRTYHSMVLYRNSGVCTRTCCYVRTRTATRVGCVVDVKHAMMVRAEQAARGARMQHAAGTNTSPVPPHTLTLPAHSPALCLTSSCCDENVAVLGHKLC